MSDVFPKFIIENDAMVIGKCTYHKQLLVNENDKENIKGGGWWRVDKDNPRHFILHGDSHDYGKASIEDIKNCLSSNKVFDNKYTEITNFISRFDKVSYDMHGIETIVLMEREKPTVGDRIMYRELKGNTMPKYGSKGVIVSDTGIFAIKFDESFPEFENSEFHVFVNHDEVIKIEQ